MTTRERVGAWLRLAPVAGVILLIATPVFAQKVTLGAKSNTANGTGNNDNGRQGFITVAEDPSGATSLFYFLMWSVGSVNYELDGFGQIPSTSVQFTAKTAMSLNVDTGAVPDFFNELCFVDTSTQNSGCSSPQPPVLTMNLRKNGLTVEEDEFTETIKFLSGSGFHQTNSEGFNSATGMATIADQSFPTMSGAIGVSRGGVIIMTKP
jgi:hypothetical protein